MSNDHSAQERAEFVRLKRERERKLAAEPLNRMTRSRNVCAALFILSLVVNLFFLAAWAVNTDRSHRKCHTLDIIEANIKHRDHLNSMPPHRKRGGSMHGVGAPMALGQICFDAKQLTFDWSLVESYSHFYRIKGIALHGPLSGHKTHEADIVADMGTHTAGNSVIEFEHMKHILAHPSLYYVSITGDYSNFESSDEAHRVHELGRSRLR